jgi:hypothetical protein
MPVWRVARRHNETPKPPPLDNPSLSSPWWSHRRPPSTAGLAARGQFYPLVIEPLQILGCPQGRPLSLPNVRGGMWEVVCPANATGGAQRAPHSPPMVGRRIPAAPAAGFFLRHRSSGRWTSALST